MKKTSRKSMTQFILGHFKYFLMNSWNISEGYAIKVKIWDMGFSSEVRDFALDCLGVEDFYESSGINMAIENHELDMKARFDHNYLSIGFNGRSGGYLVLYGLRTNTMADQTYSADELRKMDIGEITRIYQILRMFDELKGILKGIVEYLYKTKQVKEVTRTYQRREMALVER